MMNHPHAYPWGAGTALYEDDEAHDWNPQAVKGRTATYGSVAQHFGTVQPQAPADIKHYPFRPEHTAKIDALVRHHGYQTHYAGGKYGHPDLAHKNYDTGHLMIWNPDEGSGGDFGNRAYTDAWRKTHELAHALTKPIINAKYGEAPRIGKLGHHRSQHEVERAVEWEWHAAHKQRELAAQVGVHIPDHVFHKELNTVMHDAAHRGITGKFTNPEMEGFHPHAHKVPLQTSLDLVRQHAQRLGLTSRHQTFKRGALAEWRKSDLARHYKDIYDMTEIVNRVLAGEAIPDLVEQLLGEEEKRECERCGIKQPQSKMNMIPKPKMQYGDVDSRPTWRCDDCYVHPSDRERD